MTDPAQILEHLPRLGAALEIGILWVMLYYLLRLLRGTRGAQVMTGLV